jgi:hypothetical protein
MCGPCAGNATVRDTRRAVDSATQKIFFMITITITIGRHLDPEEQAIANLNARAQMAEKNGLPKTAKSWRDMVKNLQRERPR